MGGLHRAALYGLSPPAPLRHCPPLPPGIRILGNSCIAPGCKMLAKDNLLVTVILLAEPTAGYDFDTVIVSADDLAGVLNQQRRAARAASPGAPAPP